MMTSSKIFLYELPISEKDTSMFIISHTFQATKSMCNIKWNVDVKDYRNLLFRCKNIFIRGKRTKIILTNVIIQYIYYTHYNTHEFDIDKNYFTWKHLTWKFTRRKTRITVCHKYLTKWKFLQCRDRLGWKWPPVYLYGLRIVLWCLQQNGKKTTNKSLCCTIIKSAPIPLP